MFVLLILLGFTAVAQTTTLTAPWLLVYDQEGRPRWEIRMEKLVRTKEGWEGEGAAITLYYQGQPTIRVQAPRLSADPLGRRWSLPEGLSGEGQGFTFTAKEARWEERLVLVDFSAQGKGMEIVAEEARWELSGVLEFFAAKVSASGWSLTFSYGKYVEDVLTAQKVEAEGYELSIAADFLELYPSEGRAKFSGVKVARRS